MFMFCFKHRFASKHFLWIGKITFTFIIILKTVTSLNQLDFLEKILNRYTVISVL